MIFCTAPSRENIIYQQKTLIDKNIKTMQYRLPDRNHSTYETHTSFF